MLLSYQFLSLLLFFMHLPSIFIYPHWFLSKCSGLAARVSQKCIVRSLRKTHTLHFLADESTIIQKNKIKTTSNKYVSFQCCMYYVRTPICMYHFYFFYLVLVLACTSIKKSGDCPVLVLVLSQYDVVLQAATSTRY